MLVLYPPIKPFATHHLTVAPNHEIYLEEVGNPEGVPVLMIHDGPGGHCHANDRRYFDPELYHIILFDQRGCGRSIPAASLKENNTQELINDIELIRKHLNIEHWLLAGGGWGSTLALLYAQRFAQHVKGLLLWSIFLAREQDIRWTFECGTRHFFPQEWEQFISPIAGLSLNNIAESYHQLLTGEDDLQRRAADKAWATWEARCASLDPQPKLIEEFTDPFYAKILAKLKCHYILNQYYLSNNQILQHMGRLARIPTILLHGRYNALCPLSGAWELAKAWPSAQLNVVRDAGHTATDPAMIDAIVYCSNEFKKLFR
jgi:proline iminopeptidase